MSNSVDPDETAHNEPSHLNLRCLQKPITIAYGSEKDKSLSVRVIFSHLWFVHKETEKKQKMIIWTDS